MAALSRVMVYVIVFAILYACLEGFLLLRALCRFIAGRTGAQAGGSTGRKIPLWVYWPLSILAAFLFFYSRFSSGLPRGFFGQAFSYWGLFLLIPFLFLGDVLDLGAFIVRKLRRAGKTPAVFSLAVRAGVIVFAAVTLVLGTVTARFPSVTRYTVTIEKPLPKNGIRVILISDLHIGALVHKKQLARIVSKINALEGDLVLIAGDILDRGLGVFINENLHEEFGAIKSVWGVYAVPGNHDYFGGSTGLKVNLEAAGVRLLVDETVLIDDAFYVIGRNDASRWGTGRGGEAGRKTIIELIEKLDNSLPLIMMDHQPSSQAGAETAGIDLQVSGHTHHGQIWPLSIATKRIYGHDYGLLYRGKTAIVVTSGCGVWGPPVRIGTKSEIVCIDLKNL